jgi:hypothetical protein
VHIAMIENRAVSHEIPFPSEATPRPTCSVSTQIGGRSLERRSRSFGVATMPWDLEHGTGVLLRTYQPARN